MSFIPSHNLLQSTLDPYLFPAPFSILHTNPNNSINSFFFKLNHNSILLTVVQTGSKIAVEMTIRCKSFATANEPGGLKYYSTKDDTDFNELAWVVGSGDQVGSIPALEEGMMGMHKNALRRIEIPSTAAFAARKANQLPRPTTKDGQRRYDNLFKTDATLLFEVLVTRIK